MADKFKAGQKTTAWWSPSSMTLDRFGNALPPERRQITVTVIDQESPGMYRCSTDMGVSILFKEENLG